MSDEEQVTVEFDATGIESAEEDLEEGAESTAGATEPVAAEADGPDQDEPETEDEEPAGAAEPSEPGADPPTDSTLGTFAETVVQIGQINDITNYFGGEEERAFLVPLSAAEVRRLRDVFEPPPAFKTWLTRQADGRRIYMVYGREHAGKLTCAVNAILVRTGGQPERLTFFSFRRPSINSPTLDAFLWGKEASKREKETSLETVYLAEDCFADRLIELSVLAGSLEDLEDRLAKLNAYLVLTSERMDDLELHLEKISAEGVSLDEVFEKHRLRYLSGDEAVRLTAESGEAAKRLWPEIRSGFHFPVQIRSFCHRLGELGFGASDEEIRRAADEAARVGRPRVRSWFRHLRPNQRLFALLASLFQGLERQDLGLIYTGSIEYLRNSGIAGLEDSRQSGHTDLLEAIYARIEVAAVPQARGPLFRPAQVGEMDDESRDGGEAAAGNPGDNAEERENRLQQVVVFTDRAVEDEVHRQVRNYSALLWSLRPLFLQLAHDRQESGDWRFRKALGAAIGQLGASDHGELVDLLQELAIGRSDGVTAVAGAALGQSFASDPGFQTRGLQLLTTWIRDPRLTWAAALAVWRAYYGILEAAGRIDPGTREVLDQLLGILEEIVRGGGGRNREQQRIAAESTRGQARSRAHHERLIRDWIAVRARRNREGVVYALWMIARVDLAAVVALIDRWLEEESQTHLPEVAEAVAVGLFREAGERRPSHTTVEQLQRLVPKLLASDTLPFNALGIVMQTLRSWSRWDVRDLSFSGLLRAANRCPEGAAERFCLAIVRFWLDQPGTSPEACRSGQALLARILAMDGAAVAPPGGSPGLILLDTVGRVELGQLADVARRLYWLLQALVDTEIRLLGTTSALAGEEPGPRQPAGSPRPRLIVPAVEALGHLPAFVLVFASGEILDLDDALRQPWADRLIVAMPASDVRTREEGRHSSGAEIVYIEPDRPDTALWPMLEKVLAQRFRTLADEDVEQLGAWFRERFDPSVGDADEAWRLITARLDELDRTDPDRRDDPARRVLCALRWQARIEPAGCVERLRVWRSEDDKDLRYSVAGAAGRMLFRMIGIGDWRPSVDTHGCLFDLADALARDWNGARAVLAAALVLIEDDDRWKTFLCSRPGGVLLAWLRRLDPALRSRLEEVAREWAKPEKDEEVPRAVRALVEEMWRLAEQGESLTLPQLPPGGSFRVLVLDADNDSPRQMRQVVELALRMIKHSRRDLAHPWLVFRLGRYAPLEGLDDRITPKDLLTQRQRPRLLYPILDRLPIDAVDLVLVIAAAPPHDESDLAGSAWLAKTCLQVTDRSWSKGGLLARVPLLPDAREIAPFIRSLVTISGVGSERDRGGNPNGESHGDD